LSTFALLVVVVAGYLLIAATVDMLFSWNKDFGKIFVTLYNTD
jgi:uncharacterized protein (DUF3084 family)